MIRNSLQELAMGAAAQRLNVVLHTAVPQERDEQLRRREESVFPWRNAMQQKTIVLLTLLTIMVQGGNTLSHDKTAEVAERTIDRVAIEKLTKDMIQAFDKRDAAAISAFWTEQGEFIRNDEEPIRGRAAMQQGYEEFFKTLKGKPTLEIQFDALRFPSANMAAAEVTLQVKNDEGKITASTWQDIALVREGCQWKLALVREWDRDIGLDVNLNELGWLIGTWQAVTPDRNVTITYEWDDNKAFIRGEFIVKEGADVIESGREIIGKDNAQGVIRGWVFQSDGGFGEGLWTREGRTWSVDVHGVASDGRQLTATTIYIHVDPNTFTWQAVNQAFDGVPVPDTQPVKVTRQNAAK
jgi:uncharacterized protein (TIGR02246 family)